MRDPRTLDDNPNLHHPMRWDLGVGWSKLYIGDSSRDEAIKKIRQLDLNIYTSLQLFKKSLESLGDLDLKDRETSSSVEVFSRQKAIDILTVAVDLNNDLNRSLSLKLTDFLSVQDESYLRILNAGIRATKELEKARDKMKNSEESGNINLENIIIGIKDSFK